MRHRREIDASTSTPSSSLGRASTTTSRSATTRAPTTRSRETVLAERRKNPGGSTAVCVCGANPGMVSWFVKQGLVDVAHDLGDKAPEPKTKDEWARLAQRLGVKGVHIAERDTQRAKSPSRATYSSTPGRSKVFSPKACSRPNSAGEHREMVAGQCRLP